MSPLLADIQIVAKKKRDFDTLMAGGAMSRESVFKSAMKFLRDSIGLVFVAAGFQAWLFITFLSSALYQGNTSVFSATLFTMLFSFSILVTTALILGVSNNDHQTKSAYLYFLIGILVLFALSFLPFWEFFQGLVNLGASVTMGFLAGVAFSFVVIGLFKSISRLSFRRSVTLFLVSFGLSLIIFFFYMVIVPVSLMATMLWILPLISLVSLLMKGKQDLMQGSSKVFARSLESSLIKGVFENKVFLHYTWISGFLLGYCYNIYPKTTRFAGAYTDIIFGLVSPAAAVFLLVCCAIFAASLLIPKIFKRNTIYVIGGIFLVALSVLYFALPYMPNSWMLFVLLDSAAVSTVLFVCIGVVLKYSSGDKKGFTKTMLFLVLGVFIGTSVAVLFIETTVPDALISVPEIVSDVIIVGTPAIGFVVLSFVLFVLSRQMFFPVPMPGKPEVSSGFNVEKMAASLAERYALTPREEEISAMLLQGRSGPYISEHLYLSKSTVKTHIRHIYGKTSVSSRQQLIDLAHGL